jgi:integrase
MARTTLQRHVPHSRERGIYWSERADGRKVYEVRFYDAEGNRRYEVVGPRFDQALARRAEIQGGKARGEQPGSVSLTFAEAVEGWREIRNVKPRTAASYDDVLRVHVLPRWSRVKARDVRPLEIQGWISGLKRKDGRAGELAGGTKRIILDVFSLVLDYAVEAGAVNGNPCRQLPRRAKPRSGTLAARILTREEETALLAAAKPWLRPIILTALLGGLRLGEVCGLRWGDIDFAADKLHIRRTLSTADGKTFGTPKGGRAESIDLNPQLRALLRALPSRFGGPDAPVFQTRHGGRHLHPRTVTDAFTLARTKALSDQPRAFRFHDLRHTCASRLVNGGLPATWVQGYLRHANLATTLGYLHDDAAEERKAEAWAALGG